MQIRKIGVLVVHGIGEQKRFQSLEEVATNFLKALRKRPGGPPHAQVLRGDQDSRLSPEASLREVPYLLRWTIPGKEMIEIAFREVFWADLDHRMTLRQWLRLAGWALSMPGVRIFGRGDGIPGSQEADPALHHLRAPRKLTPGDRGYVRLKLFFIAWVLCPVLVFAGGFQNVILRRLGIHLALDRLLYDYVGDVMLYQDWVPGEERVEGFGEKARVAIRRRMVQALVRTASEAERGALDGYYIFSHSLGTVVAFNGLMENSLTLPNYLTEEEWGNLPSTFKTKSQMEAPPVQLPPRPAWLGPRDALDRSRLLSRLRGFLTIGSPLDKFASLWPAIVPICEEPIAAPIPWLNVHDPQDLVAGRIDLFTDSDADPGETTMPVSGFLLRNHAWAASWVFPQAHTSYWKVGASRERLTDCLIDWLEKPKAPASLPRGVMPARLARMVGWFSLAICVPAVLLLATEACLAAYRWLSGQPSPVSLLFIVILFAPLVLACSVCRRAYERWKWGPQS
jgi:hypothetical protein